MVDGAKVSAYLPVAQRVKHRETKPQERGQIDEIKKHLAVRVRDIAVNVPGRDQKWKVGKEGGVKPPLHEREQMGHLKVAATGAD